MAKFTNKQLEILATKITNNLESAHNEKVKTLKNGEDYKNFTEVTVKLTP